MRYLILIHLDEKDLNALPEAEMSSLNAAHVVLNESLRGSGHFIEAEALTPAQATKVLRMRDGKARITDGPFAEAKEMVAGFYLIEARDMSEALEIASRIPSAARGTIEVRETRRLVVDGKEVDA